MSDSPRPDRVLALHRLDLPAALQLVQQLRGQAEPGCDRMVQLSVIDPVLFNYAMLTGVPDVSLMRVPDVQVSMSVVPQAWAATRALCTATDAVMAEFIPETRGAAWCGHMVQHLHIFLLGYRAAADLLATRLRTEQVHLLLPDQPFRFGVHSFLPGIVLATLMRERGVSVQVYANSQLSLDPPLIADPASVSDDTPVQLLCHLATCFYDSIMFSSEVAASGRQAMVLPSQHYDVETPGLTRCVMATPQGLAQRMSQIQQRELETTLEKLRSVLTQHFSPMVGAPRWTQLQVDALVEAFRHQALLFMALEQRFAAAPPDTLLISNHDTGQHGALLSFATRHRMRVVMVPHSKIFNVPVKCYGHEMLCLTHALEGGEVQDLYGRPVPTALLDFPQERRWPARAPQPLRTVGLVLNGLSASGLCLVDLVPYVAGVEQLRTWCVQQGVACRIRVRTNESAASLLVSALGIPLEDLQTWQEGPIADFGEDCDLVVGYDVPTSGVLDILARGTPVVQAFCRLMGPEEARMISAEVVHQEPVAGVLALLERLKHDPVALWQYTQDQRLRLLQAGRSARPLRSYLQADAPV